MSIKSTWQREFISFDTIGFMTKALRTLDFFSWQASHKLTCSCSWTISFVTLAYKRLVLLCVMSLAPWPVDRCSVLISSKSSSLHKYIFSVLCPFAVISSLVHCLSEYYTLRTFSSLHSMIFRRFLRFVKYTRSTNLVIMVSCCSRASKEKWTITFFGIQFFHSLSEICPKIIDVLRHFGEKITTDIHN